MDSAVAEVEVEVADPVEEIKEFVVPIPVGHVQIIISGRIFHIPSELGDAIKSAADEHGVVSGHRICKLYCAVVIS